MTRRPEDTQAVEDGTEVKLILASKPRTEPIKSHLESEDENLASESLEKLCPTFCEMNGPDSGPPPL